MYCKKCGNELRNNAKFCDKCGEKVVREIVCSKCGEKLREGARFCDQCGTPICESANLEANSARITTHLKESFDYDFMRFHQFHQWQKGIYSVGKDAALAVFESGVYIKINKNYEIICDRSPYEAKRIIYATPAVDGIATVGYERTGDNHSFYIESLDDNGNLIDSKLLFSTADLPEDISRKYMTCREALMSDDNVIVLLDYQGSSRGDDNMTIICNYSLGKKLLTYHVYECYDTQFNYMLSSFNYGQSILSEDNLYLIENKVSWGENGSYNDYDIVKINIASWKISKIANVPIGFYRLLDIKNKTVWINLGKNDLEENGFEPDSNVFGARPLSKNGKLQKAKGIWSFNKDMVYFDGTRAFKNVTGGVIEINKDGSVKETIIEGLTFQNLKGEVIPANPSNMETIIWEGKLFCVVDLQSPKAYYVDLGDNNRTVHEVVVHTKMKKIIPPCPELLYGNNS